MATFKVGQRVRLIAYLDISLRRVPIGAEGTITAEEHQGRVWRVTWDHYQPPGKYWTACSEQLAPLTNPKADAFMESIRKLKPYEEPKVRETEPLSARSV